MKALNLSLIIAIFLIIFFCVFIKETGGIKLSNFQSDIKQTEIFDYKFVYLSVVMVLGIFCGEFYNRLEASGSDKIGKSDIIEFFASKSLWRSLIASPIVFGGIYTMSKGQPDIVMALLFAFENGFFCNIVLAKKKKEFQNSMKKKGVKSI